MLIYSSNTQKEGHTDSAFSSVFALPFRRSLPFATPSQRKVSVLICSSNPAQVSDYYPTLTGTVLKASWN